MSVRDFEWWVFCKQREMAESSQYNPIYAKESKDIPDWMKAHHDWQAAVAVDKLPKYQLKVKMCCMKCQEKVIEEIREVYGVFDVRAERLASKVVVVASSPSGLNEHEVLRKAKKIHKKAKFVPLDDKEKPKKQDDEKKKKEEEEKKKKEAEEKKKKEAQDSIFTWKPLVHWAGPYYAPTPVAYAPGEYRPSQNYAPRYYYPPLPNQPEDGYFRQYVYHN